MIESRTFVLFSVYVMNVTRKLISVAVNFKICKRKTEHFPQKKMESIIPTKQTPSSEIRLQMATSDCEITKIAPAIRQEMAYAPYYKGIH